MLDERQRAAIDRVLAEEDRERRHLVAYLSGAHAYGFPSPDSDFDVKCVHVEPTCRLAGLAAPPPHAQRMATLDGCELDYGSTEVGTALAGVLQGNGNYLERLLGRLVLRTSPWHASLAPVVRRSLCRRVHRHYRGFALGQLREAEGRPTAKKLLYVLRTALSGARLLLSGELVTDVNELIDEHGFGSARELIRIKSGGERTRLEAGAARLWMDELQRALALLDAAQARSPLPGEAANRPEVEDWLTALRREVFD